MYSSISYSKIKMKTFQSPQKVQLCHCAVTQSLSPWPLATADVFIVFPFLAFYMNLMCLASFCMFGFFGLT